MSRSDIWASAYIALKMVIGLQSTRSYAGVLNSRERCILQSRVDWVKEGTLSHPSDPSNLWMTVPTFESSNIVHDEPEAIKEICCPSKPEALIFQSTLQATSQDNGTSASKQTSSSSSSPRSKYNTRSFSYYAVHYAVFLSDLSCLEKVRLGRLAWLPVKFRTRWSQD